MTTPPPPVDHWLGRLAGFLVRRRRMLLVAALVLTALAAVPASRLTLDESIESFYASSDPLLRDYLDSKRWFGGDEFILVAYEDPDLLSNDRQDALRAFADQFRDTQRFPGLQGASTQDLASNLSMEGVPGMDDLPRLVRTLARRIMRDRIIDSSRRVLIGDDDRTTAIVLRLKPEAESGVSRKETFAAVRAAAAAHRPPAYVAGEPVQVHDMFRYVDRDSTVLGWASTGLMMLVILSMFRSIRWVLLPLAVVQVTLIWTQAVLYFTGLKLSMVSSMLTSLLTIIGIATITHITVLYRDLRRSLDRPEAFRHMFVDAAVPVFWVTFTTAVGFWALLCSEITPVRSFSWMMSIATMLLLVTCLLILPGGILMGQFDVDPRRSRSDERVAALLNGMTGWTLRHPKTVLGVTTVLFVAGGIGCLRQKIETDFSRNFREDSEIVQSIEFFEQKLGGVGTWEINFSTPAALTDEMLESVRTLAQRLRELELPDGTKLTKVVAYTDGLDMVPERLGKTVDERRKVLNGFQPEFEPTLYNAAEQRMRLVLRSKERQPAEVKLQLIDAALDLVRQTHPEAQATGLYVLLANLVTSLLGDQLNSALISLAGMIACMWAAFRSLRIVLISLAPNILPILLVVGGMGLTGINANIGTAMIASVSLGLTIDQSILYLTDYQRARREGLDHAAALRKTHEGVGLALVFANIALIVGFMVLSLSEFIPLVYFGVLVSVAMAGGLLGNLILLPLLLAIVPERAR